MLGIPVGRFGGGVVSLGTAMSSNQGGADRLEPGETDRLDTYCTGGTRVLDAFPAQAVVDRRDHPCGHKNSDKLDVPDDP